MLASDLHVISVISNPVRYASRERLMHEFIERQAKSGCTQWIIEATFGERESVIVDPNNPHHILVRCDDEIWLKENLINKCVTFLPQDWKYVMWLDADVEFMNDNWVMETLQALQHYETVQPFSHAVDLGPKHEALEVHTGFAYQYVRGVPFTPNYGTFWHPGYCWAFTRFAWEKLGGMIDRAICGAADHHMACALIGKAASTVPGNVHPSYLQMVLDWEKRAEIHLARDVGYVAGSILHYFHGAKVKRNYIGRWDIVTGNKFDPHHDLETDWQGLLKLKGNKPALRDQLRGYFRSRDEDSK